MNRVLFLIACLLCFSSAVMAGVEIQAYSLRTMLEHKNIRYTSVFVSILIGLLLCYILAMLFSLVGRFVNSRGKRLRIFFTESRILLTTVGVLYVLVISLLAFLVFELFDVYVNMVIVLAMVSFVAFSMRLYLGITKSLKA